MEVNKKILNEELIPLITLLITIDLTIFVEMILWSSLGIY
jgi:hypothetical protein